MSNILLKISGDNPRSAILEIFYEQFKHHINIFHTKILFFQRLVTDVNDPGSFKIVFVD